MNVRIALLFSGILIAASTGAAQAALQPQDPDQAPIASVDRFSDKAATFLVRSAVFQVRSRVHLRLRRSLPKC
jgi:hypothetical protein